MPRPSNTDSISIRLRLEQELLERIDRAAGERGRQRFIEEAILWRLDQEIPPVVMELMDEVSQLKARVSHLEGTQSTSPVRGVLNKVAENQICRDELDRRILEYFLQNEGATTPELAKNVLGVHTKRRTILDRIAKLNERATQLVGVEILRYEKGILKGKRGAWWLDNRPKIVS